MVSIANENDIKPIDLVVVNLYPFQDTISRPECSFEDAIENIDIDINKIDQLVLFAKKEEVDLTIIGPEVPLSKGIVDTFIENKLKVFGPKKLAAQLESSKDFAKSFMERHKIPTAKYKTFTNIQEAHNYIKENGNNGTFNPDGLAAGIYPVTYGQSRRR